MNGPLADPHAQQFTAGQVSHGVRDGALQGAGFTECVDHLRCAALELRQRVISDVQGVHERPKLVGATAVEKINIGVVSTDDVGQQLSHGPLRTWRRQRQVLSAEVGQPPLELRPRAAKLLDVIHASEP